MEVLSTAAELRKTADDPENAEHFVKVEWLDQVPESQACAENGLFGIPSVVCRPRVSKWLHTIERLKTKFPKWNRDAGKVAGETR